MYGRKIYLSPAVRRAEKGWWNGGRRLGDEQTRWGYRNRETRLNPNVQNVFFMRAESIVIWSFVDGMGRVRANEEVGYLEMRGDEWKGGGEQINWWIDG